MYLVVKLFTIDRRHFCFKEAWFLAVQTWKNSASDSAGKHDSRNTTELSRVYCCEVWIKKLIVTSIVRFMHPLPLRSYSCNAQHLSRQLPRVKQRTFQTY